jgi:acyl-CoA reductase-like NAD-dependent aldehyde dehydrogenase
MQLNASTILRDQCLRGGAWTGTPYGPAVYCYTLSRAWRVAGAFEYGMIGVNERIVSSARAPFGGVKDVMMGGLEG